MPAYELIDHTSDIKVKITADCPEKLFEESIRALICIITDCRVNIQKEPVKVPTDRHKKKYRVKIRFHTLEEGIIEFLNKIIFLVYTYGFIPFSWKLKLKKDMVKVIFKGVVDYFDFIEREVKAATYHNALINFENGNYEISIVFDV